MLGDQEIGQVHKVGKAMEELQSRIQMKLGSSRARVATTPDASRSLINVAGTSKIDHSHRSHVTEEVHGVHLLPAGVYEIRNRTQA